MQGFSTLNVVRTFIPVFAVLISAHCSSMGGLFRHEEPPPPVRTFRADAGMQYVKLGIDILIEKQLELLAGKRIGLITNQSGVNRDLESSADILFQHEDVQLTTLFAPEHGIRGDIPAGEPVAQYTDQQTGLPVFSLYGVNKKPTPEMLAAVDVLIFDIQDVGVRPYTYIYTMAHAMEAARDAGIAFVILDRPNPLGGELIEGNVLDPDFKSFIGLYPIPYVHGMTAGELAWLFNREFGIGVNLRIVPMEGWRRDMVFNDTGLSWVPPSHHIPSSETVPFYAATGSIGELGTVSVGVGYTTPFRVVGAPWIHAQSLADELNGREIPGVFFRPMHWQQFYGIFKGQYIGGIALHINDQRIFSPFATGIHILDAIGDLYPEHDIFPDNRARNFFQATGTDMIFNRLKAGVPADVIINTYQESLAKFKRLRLDYLIY